MKKNSIILVTALICILVLGFYYFNFNGTLSANHSRWAEFGDFLGGVLATILSFMALIFVVITNNEQLKATKTSTDQQIEALRNETRLKEQLALIDSIREILYSEMAVKYKVSYINMDLISPFDVSYDAPKDVELNLFEITLQLTRNVDNAALRKAVVEKDWTICTKLKIFSSQLIHYVNLIDELHSNLDVFSINISNLKFRLSLFNVCLPILKDVGLLDDNFIFRYQCILCSPQIPNKKVFDSNGLEDVFRHELEEQGIKGFDIDLGTLKTELHGTKLMFRLDDAGRGIIRESISPDVGLWSEVA